jgi:hypothetical protein
MSVPFRYDLWNATFVNNSISILNRKLKKVVNAFSHASFIETENTRKLFTNHGLHRNKLGKRLVTYQIASFLQSALEHNIMIPISLDWHKKTQENNHSIPIGEDNQLLGPIRNSTRNKRVPVTRTQDFLWVNQKSITRR